jgi:CRISPR-associated endonuclease/helicase Cas3
LIGNCEGKVPLLQQSFMTAGKLFEAIDAPTQAVIVPYGEGENLIAELCRVAKEYNSKRYYELLKKTQRYSVNIFPNVWQKLKEEKAIYEIQNEGIYYLDERYYSEDFGLSTEPVVFMSCNIC